MSSTFSTQPYKGTRDFYPNEDQFNNLKLPLSRGQNLQDFGGILPKNKNGNSGGIDFLLYRQYIFDTWRKTLLECGFVEYDCSVIEQAEIYLAKSGEELGGKQLYNFHDKSDRHIALRPEMTPSLARMVADKYKELRFPLRWFSIPNCFRYEAPQKGRLREFWQLNVDIIGQKAGAVDLEMLFVISKIFEAFGATKESFTIKFNHRQVLDNFLEKHNFLDKKEEIYKLLDDSGKMDYDSFLANVDEIFGHDKSKFKENFYLEKNILEDIYKKHGDYWQNYVAISQEYPEMSQIMSLTQNSSSIFPAKFTFDPTIVRGLAYYTGLVFECFDNNPANPRALFGGGRYDDLLDLFDKPKTPSIGLGMGDVTMLEFLQNWGLLDGNPNFESWKKANVKEKVGIMVMADNSKSKIENGELGNKNKILNQNEVEQLREILKKL